MRHAVSAALLAALLPVAAPAQTVDARDPQTIVAALQDLGYRAALGTDAVGDPMIESAASGVDFTVFFYGCTDGAGCQDLQFYQGFITDRVWTAEDLNPWNRDKLMGQAYVDDEGDPRISFFVAGVTDMRRATFDRVVDSWELGLSEFLEFIDW